MSQTHIGQALGLTYVHVCRTLQILREQKIVRFANHRFEIIDPQALVGAAGIEVDMLYYEHRAPFRELARARSPADRDVPNSLPVGWIPMEYNTASRTSLAQRQAA